MVAVTTTRVFGIVERPDRISHAATVDLPTPCPLARAIKIGSSRCPISRPSRNRRPSSASSARCHSRGPVASASSVPASPQGNANKMY